MACDERSGFLFAHRCSGAVEVMCARCNKSVCNQHQRLIGDTRYCTTCARDAGRPHPGPAEGGKGGRVSPYYDDYFDDPYWYRQRYYSDYSYYDASDKAVFDPSSSPDAGEAFESDFYGS